MMQLLTIYILKNARSRDVTWRTGHNWRITRWLDERRTWRTLWECPDCSINSTPLHGTVYMWRHARVSCPVILRSPGISSHNSNASFLNPKINNTNCWPLSILSEDEWGDLECLYITCQAVKTDGGLFADTGVDERGENERQSENDSDMKTVS